MHWLRQQLFDQLTRLDLRPASFFDRFRAMDPETRDDLLEDAARSLARHGHIGIGQKGEAEGHFSLMLIWNHAPAPTGSPTIDLDEVMKPMDPLDEEIEGESRYWRG